jgi:PAS domain S-box-containing protein
MFEVLLSSNLLETLPDAIVAVDREGTIMHVNSQAQELFGYDKELIGQTIEMLVAEGYRSKHHHHSEKFVEAPKARRMGADLELHGRRRNGSEFPVEISLSPVASEKGMFGLSAIRDISDGERIAEQLRRASEELQRRTSEQLAEYRSRLAAIIDSSEDAILSKDLNGIITSWNRGAQRIYGYTAEEGIGKHISLLTPADLGGQYEATAETQEPSEVSFRRQSDLLRLMRLHGELSLWVTQHISQDYASTCREIRDLILSDSAREKLARLLVGFLDQNTEARNPSQMKLGLTHEEIGQVIGTSRVIVSRLFAGFKKQHLIQQNGCTLVIPSRMALESLITA